jgi:hypothetical protein
MSSSLAKVLSVILLLFAPTLLRAQTSQDSDNDGIPDAWERAGFVNVTLQDGTKQKLDLTKDGPLSSDHKDIFVWVAWMEDSTHTHKPSATAMQIVKDAFSNAPITNPDGKTGIRVHIYFSSKALPEVANLGTTDTHGNYNWTAFDKIKKQVFPSELEHIFHFCVFAHDIDSDHHSGLSKDIGAYDFIVSLGAFGPSGVGDTQSQAGTFMHELGHNLGLRHGGADDINYKPNYISIMNYFFQLDGLPINGEPGNFDYSRFSLDADENALQKDHGFNVSPALAIYGSQYFCAIHPNHSMTIDSIGTAVDWDCSGSLTGDLKADINDDGMLCDLKGFNDWEGVHLTFTSHATGGATPPNQRPLLLNELTPSIANGISLPPIAHVQAAPLSGGVKIWWKQVPLDRVVAYKVFRTSPQGQQAELAITDKNIYVDTPSEKGAYSYYITGLYVPFGNAKETKPADFLARWAGRVIDNVDAIAEIERSTPKTMQHLQTMGVKSRSQAGISPPRYLVETTASAPARIVLQ